MADIVGTVFRAVPGYPGNLIEAGEPDDYWHWAAVEDIRLEGNKEPGGGHNLTVTQVGENCHVARILSKNAPQDGIYVTGPGGATGLGFEHLSVFVNGRYGVNLDQCGQVYQIRGLSGDNNVGPLLRYAGFGTLLISGVKVEMQPPTAQDPVFLLEPHSGGILGVGMENASINGSGSTQNAIRIVGGGSLRLGLRGLYANLVLNGIEDARTGARIAVDAIYNQPAFTYESMR